MRNLQVRGDDKQSQGVVTLAELNARPGQIIREVFFTRQPKTVTANRKPVAVINPVK